MVSVLLFPLVERFSVSCMRDFIEELVDVEIISICVTLVCKAHTTTHGWFCGSSHKSISWPDSLQLGNRPQNDCCTFVPGLYVTHIHHFPAFVNSYHSFNATRNGPENHYYSLYLKTVWGQILSFYLSNIFLLNYWFSYMLINWHCAQNLHP